MRHTGGFTLIELIVTISIIMVITGGVVANLTKYNDNQRLEQIGLTLQEDLHTAQGKALSGQKPSGSPCAGFLGYRVTFLAGSYAIVPECLEGNDYPDDSKIVTLPAGMTFTEPLCPSFRFLPLVQGTDLPTSTDVVLTSGTATYTITIYRSGVINQKS